MQEATSKERMLKKIRKALIEKVEHPFPKLEEVDNVYTSSDELLEIQFAEEFTKVNGQFVFCEDLLQFQQSIKEISIEKNWNNIFCWEPIVMELLGDALSYASTDENFVDAGVGITSCEALVSRTGSIFISSDTESGRRLSIYPTIHVVVAFASQLKRDTIDAIKYMNEKYQGKLPSLISDTTGPSRTADIEKTLVLGAHGPRELFVFLIDDINE